MKLICKEKFLHLKKADDAILLDTTKMTIDEVLQEIIRLANA